MVNTKPVLTISLIVFCFLQSSVAYPIDKLPLSEVETGKLISECQPNPVNELNEFTFFTWYLPKVFWDAGAVEEDLSFLLNETKKYDIVAVGAWNNNDITNRGRMIPYSQSEVSKRLQIIFEDEKGKSQIIKPVEDPEKKAELLFDVMKTLLEQNLGHMGAAVSIYAIPRSNSSGELLLNPYSVGKLSFQFVTREEKLLVTEIPFPLDSLHKPRKCPNGKDAHISWKYCPWTGKALPN